MVITSETVLAVCGVIIAVGGAVGYLYRWMKIATKPIDDLKAEYKSLSAKVVVLEQQVRSYEKGKEQIEQQMSKMDEGNRVTQKALLALLSYIDGSDKTGLGDAKKALTDYLFDK